jgi:hypothetical protein
MTNDDPPTTEFPSIPENPTPAPAASRRLRQWMWMAPGVVVVAVAAFLAGRAVASSSSAPAAQTVSTAPASGAPGSVTSGAPQSAPITTPTGKKGKTSKTGKVSAASVVGTVEAMSGSIWTLQKTDGSTVSVTITPKTQYGTKAKPEIIADFKVGAKVLVVAAKNAVGQSAITAKRVVNRVKASTTDLTTAAAPSTAQSS